MRILHALTYFSPHISGLTIYVERLARGLVRAGHEVTVLTSHYDHALPLEETIDGVRIVRVPVVARLSKGVIMPTVGQVASRLMIDHELVHLHLPQFDGAGLALRAKLARRPVTLTYHCDIELPRGALNAIAQPVIHLANHIAARWTDTLVAYTDDYARHSPFLSRYLPKLKVIPPPVEIARPTAADLAAFRAKWGLNGGPAPARHPQARRARPHRGLDATVLQLHPKAIFSEAQKPQARALMEREAGVLAHAEHGGAVVHADLIVVA